MNGGSHPARMAIVHLKDGKITDTWDEWDRLGFLTQIGALPMRPLEYP